MVTTYESILVSQWTFQPNFVYKLYLCSFLFPTDSYVLAQIKADISSLFRNLAQHNLLLYVVLFWTQLSLVVHDFTDTSIYRRVKDFNSYFIVTSVISRILRMKWCKTWMQTLQNYHLVTKWTGNCFIL